MKNITIAYAFSITLIYAIFSFVGWSINPGEWSEGLRIVCGAFVTVFWIAFWMKIEHDRVVW